MKIGETILKLREEKKMSQEEFATILSCDEANYFKLGKGKELSGFTNISKD